MNHRQLNLSSPVQFYSTAGRIIKTVLNGIVATALLFFAGCSSKPSERAIQLAIEKSLFGCENHPWFAVENFVFENGAEETKNRYTAVVAYDIVLKKSGKEMLDAAARGDGEGFSPELLPLLVAKWFGKVLIDGKMSPEGLSKGTRVHQREKVSMVKMDKGWAVASELDSLFTR